MIASDSSFESVASEGQVTTVTLDDSKKIIAVAEKKASEIGQPMNIAVIDVGGNLIAHERMDGAWIGSIDVSINKAFTSRAFNISIEELAKQSQPNGPFFGVHASNDGKVMIFAGVTLLQEFQSGRVHGFCDKNHSSNLGLEHSIVLQFQNIK